MKKKNLKSLKLNKESISNFNASDVNGGRKLPPSEELSCYPDDCVTVTTINIECGISHMYGSCNISCNLDIVCY